MEAFLLQDQTISAYKESRISSNNVLVSCPVPSNFKRKLVGTCTKSGPLEIHGSFYRSLPCQKPPIHQQPPLLPLPVNTSNLNLHQRNFMPNQNRASLPNKIPIHRKCENRDQSREKHVKKLAPLNHKPKMGLIMTYNKRLGPDPSDLPKEVPRLFRSVSYTADEFMKYSSNEKWSGAVCTIASPPPSSLPLPRFSLKGKVGCTARAGGIDSGATDNLRRLLKLH